MREQHIYNVGVYCRLSIDDGTDSESMSIGNQKQLLNDYVKKEGWNIFKEYIDDGYSGTNFDRPGFKNMISDIENGKVNMVVVKDLSRLGRNYIMCGQYTEVYFPEKNVRFLALNDGIDSIRTSNDIAPFKNILNDMFAKDISVKIKSSLQTKAKRGEYLGAVDPYGYRRSPEDKHKLIINEETAPIVKRMFDLCNSGYGATAIANIFNREHILSPRDYDLNKKHDEEQNGPYVPKYCWINTAVRHMLRNEMYLGHMVNCRCRSLSYRNQKKVSNDKLDWIIVKDTHEPIISQEVFEQAEKMLKQRFNVGSWDGVTTHLFSGITFCECGRSLTRHASKSPQRNYLECPRYRQYGSQMCLSHRVRLETLEELVKDDINKNIRLVETDEIKAIKRVTEAKCSTEENKLKASERELEKATKRQSELNAKIKRMYEDNISGKLPDHLFTMFVSDYEAEKNSLEKKAGELQNEIKKLEANRTDVSEFISIIKKCRHITELDKHIVHELIDRIVVSEVINEEGKSEKTITIYYKFVGVL